VWKEFIKCMWKKKDAREMLNVLWARYLGSDQRSSKSLSLHDPDTHTTGRVSHSGSEENVSNLFHF
jgi:hypothetical protein